MTANELSILKNAVLDGTEAYVDARLEDLPFAKTEIGVVTDNTQKDSNDKTLHTVRVGSSTRYKIYKNVLSTGNIEYPIGTVAFMVIPNGQYSNSFILGQLDTSPCNIKGGQIHIGKMNTTIDGKDYFFNVDSQGEVTILKGGIKYNYNSTLQDYSFIVDKNGIKSGIIGTSTSDKDWFFNLDNNGSLKIKSGSISLGKINTNIYKFNVDNDGNIVCKNNSGIETFSVKNGDIVCKNNSGNEIFSVKNGAVTISGYLEDGAFDGSTRSDRTRIDGSHIETGSISSNGADGSDGEFSTNGTILNLDTGWLSSKNFLIDSKGNAKFKGDISGASGLIGGFEIGSDALIINNAKVSESLMGCGEAGYGLAKIIGNTSSAKNVDRNFGCVELSCDGYGTTNGAVRIFGDGTVVIRDSNGSEYYRKLVNIPQ